MEYRWIEDIEEFIRISGDWDRAVAASKSPSPFLCSDFIITWWKHFKNKGSLRILVALDGAAIAGGIPLYLKRGDGAYCFARVLSYVGGAAANYTEPFSGPLCREMLPLLKEALSSRRDWDALYLPDIRGDHGFFKECKECPRDSRYNMLCIRDHANWGVDLSAGLRQYLDTISWKLKKDLRAKRKHILKDLGAITLKEVAGDEAVREYFDIYAKFARNAFAGRKRKSSIEDGAYASFLEDLMIAMEKAGGLAVYALLAGDRTIAVNFGYKSDKGFDWVLTSFDYELKYFRPGYILMEEQLKHIYDKGGTYCNMYGHDRFFKEQWANDQKPLYKVSLIRRTLRGSCYSAIQWAENALRSNPAMVKLARRLKRA